MTSSARVEGENVILESPTRRVVLTWTEVYAAAHVLRSHLLSTLPPEIHDPCACGAKATRMDPHNDGDCPLEFCDPCYAAEVARLERESPTDAKDGA